MGLTSEDIIGRAITDNIIEKSVRPYSELTPELGDAPPGELTTYSIPGTLDEQLVLLEVGAIKETYKMSLPCLELISTDTLEKRFDDFREQLFNFRLFPELSALDTLDELELSAGMQQCLARLRLIESYLSARGVVINEEENRFELKEITRPIKLLRRYIEQYYEAVHPVYKTLCIERGMAVRDNPQVLQETIAILLDNLFKEHRLMENLSLVRNEIKKYLGRPHLSKSPNGVPAS